MKFSTYIHFVAFLTLGLAIPAIAMRVETKDLITAINNNDKNETQILIKEYPYLINQKEAKAGNTPLHAAAKKKDPFFTTILLQNGANKNTTNNNGQTALDVARNGGNEKVIALLTGTQPEKPKDLPKQQPTIEPQQHRTEVDQYGRTPLLTAAQKGEEHLVRKLITQHVNVNQPDIHGNTPLMMAAKNGFLGIVQLLLNAGANVNSFNDKKVTALNLAISEGKQEVVNLLAKNQAKLFFTVIVSFIPWNINGTAGHIFEQLPNEMRQNLEELPARELHLSLVYCSFLIEYDPDTLEVTTQSILDEVARVTSNFKLKDKLVNLTQAYPLTPQRIDKMGPYIVISYNNPNGYQQLTDELFAEIKKSIQVPVFETYGAEQKPHISFAKIKEGVKYTPNMNVLKIGIGGIEWQPFALNAQEFTRGTYELNMRVPNPRAPRNVKVPLFSQKHVRNECAPKQLVIALA